eukprot:2403846-Pleurochrysis_carterae.AAC.1
MLARIRRYLRRHIEGLTRLRRGDSREFWAFGESACKETAFLIACRSRERASMPLAARCSTVALSARCSDRRSSSEGITPGRRKILLLPRQ